LKIREIIQNQAFRDPTPPLIFISDDIIFFILTTGRYCPILVKLTEVEPFQFNIGSDRQVFHFGDAPQDMKAGLGAGVVPIGVTTGVFAAEQLTSAGAEKVFPDLKDADDILGFLLDFL